MLGLRLFLGIWGVVLAVDGHLVFVLTLGIGNSIVKAGVAAGVFSAFGIWLFHSRITKKHPLRATHSIAFELMLLASIARFACTCLHSQLQEAAGIGYNEWALFTFLIIRAPVHLRIAFVLIMAFFRLITWMAEEMALDSMEGQ